MFRYWAIVCALLGLAMLALPTHSYAAPMADSSSVTAGSAAEHLVTAPSDLRVSREPHRECAGDCEPDVADACIGLSSCTVVGIVSLPPHLREPASLSKREVRRTFGHGDEYAGPTETPPPRT